MTRRLAQVAKKVGVSEATVSRVLNGKPGVSETTRQSVLTALDVLGYERPTLADRAEIAASPAIARHGASAATSPQVLPSGDISG